MKMKFAKYERPLNTGKNVLTRKGEEKAKVKNNWDYKQAAFLNKKCR